VTEPAARRVARGVLRARRLLAAGAATLAALAVTVPVTARAWGTVGHEKIAAAVPGLLPPDAAPLAALAPLLARDAMDADRREGDPGFPEERYRHDFQLDAYRWPDAALVPARREVWDRRYGVRTVRDRGLLPWTIVDTRARLVDALRAHDSLRAARLWADLCHYLGDAAAPLHTTTLGARRPRTRERIEDQLLARYREHLTIPPASQAALRPLADPFQESLKLLRDSHAAAKTVMAAERDADQEGVGQPGYYARLWHELKPVIEQRLGAAAEAGARFGYSAWIEAGRPPLPPVAAAR